MIRVDPTLKLQDTSDGEGQTLISKYNCEQLFDKYSNLQFTIGNTMVVIKPRGYLYPPFGDQKTCEIGIQGISDNLNEYRLGVIFLRNFFVGLDYEYDSLMIGLNSENVDAEFHGHQSNPNLIKPE